MSDESAAAKVLTPFEKRVVELLLEGYTIPAIEQKLNLAEESLKQRLGRMYRKLGIRDGNPCIKLVLLMHERRVNFGIRCKKCDSPCDLGVKCMAVAGPCDRGLSCRAFWCDIGP